jgi:hypothetical protein
LRPVEAEVKESALKHLMILYPVLAHPQPSDNEKITYIIAKARFIPIRERLQASQKIRASKGQGLHQCEKHPRKRTKAR